MKVRYFPFKAADDRGTVRGFLADANFISDTIGHGTEPLGTDALVPQKSRYNSASQRKCYTIGRFTKKVLEEDCATDGARTEGEHKPPISQLTSPKSSCRVNVCKLCHL